MSDLLKFLRKVGDNLYIEFSYRLNFDGEASCGYSKVFSGNPNEMEEAFELYMELYPCGLSDSEAKEKLDRLVTEIETGKLDLDL